MRRTHQIERHGDGQGLGALQGRALVVVALELKVHRPAFRARRRARLEQRGHGAAAVAVFGARRGGGADGARPGYPQVRERGAGGAAGDVEQIAAVGSDDGDVECDDPRALARQHRELRMPGE
jgi:hypothetical protein